MDISKQHISVTAQRMSDEKCDYPNSFKKRYQNDNDKKQKFSKKMNNQLILQSKTSDWQAYIDGINKTDQKTICLGINCDINEEKKCATKEEIDMGD
jgi:hypothetical protein